MEENKTNSIEEPNLEKETVAEISDKSVLNSFFKKNKKLIIVGALITIAVGCISYSIYHKNKMEQLRISMEESTAETVHNLSARKEMIGNDLKVFKEDISNMDVTFVDSNQKIEIISAVNSLNEAIQNKDRIAMVKFIDLTNIIENSGVYTDADVSKIYEDKFTHIIETMIRMQLITPEESDSLTTELDEALTVMLSNGIIKMIKDLNN